MHSWQFAVRIKLLQKSDRQAQRGWDEEQRSWAVAAYRKTDYD
jgi:hypothetical protein